MNYTHQNPPKKRRLFRKKRNKKFEQIKNKNFLQEVPKWQEEDAKCVLGSADEDAEENVLEGTEEGEEAQGFKWYA